MAQQQQEQRQQPQQPAGATEKFFWRKDPTAQASPNGTEEAQSSSASSSQANLLSQAQKPGTKSKPILVGIPCHNAENSIAKTVVALSSIDADFVICDDGSTDSTEDIARRMGCRVLKHPRELGRSDAVTSLFLAAKRLEAEALLTVGTDSQFNIMDATKLIESVQRGDVDIAIGSQFSVDAIAEAQRESKIADPDSLLRAYGKKALVMISPPGTSSVVIEKEVLEFAEQQGLKVREYPTTKSSPAQDQILLARRKMLAKNRNASLENHFEARFMNYVSVKHPLVFFGIPSISFFYVAVLETIENSSLTQISLDSLVKFGTSLASSPFFLTSIALSIGSAILFALKHQRGADKE